jgi:signal transduction histidine kinase
VEVEVMEAPDGRAVLVVRDQGIGIAKADQKRIFERFERAVPSHQYGGFGLGLWIVRQFVEAHGGRIYVDSEAGVGSTFTVVLPTRPPT